MGASKWGALVGILVVLAPAAGASGRAYLPPAGRVFAGVTGGTTIVPFERMVGKHPPVFEIYMTWNTPTGWLASPDSAFRSRLGLAISTAPGYAQRGVISPRGIALGGSDRFLVSLCRNLAHSRRVVYVRLMGEMNGYWNAYAPFSKDGAFRGVQNSPRFFVKAWKRTVLILRGGPVAPLNRHLRRLRLPALKVRMTPTAKLPRPKVAFLWVPQDAGSPDIPANAPGVFWPGGAYVDWVGTDFFGSSPNFRQLSRFYSGFPDKPFVLSEWSVLGADRPGFVRALFAWARAHPRLRMLNYYQGFTPSSRANLARFPASRATLRDELRSRRYVPFAPEYAHPSARASRAESAAPPTPPSPGAPPSPPA